MEEKEDADIWTKKTGYPIDGIEKDRCQDS
jgi:hypothetical protein